jgi:hypothetical protein
VRRDAGAADAAARPVPARSSIRGHPPASAFVFGLGNVTWAAIQAFAEAPDFEHAPPVIQVAQAELAAPGTATGWGTNPAGQFGVACFVGVFEHPTITLRGPYRTGG